MENASKALIIAGAILIAILLIGIGVALINALNGPQEEALGQISGTAMNIFNGKFEKYAGQNKRGSDVKTLLSEIITNNAATQSGRIVKVKTTGSQITTGAISTATDNTTQLSTLRNNIVGSKYYTVTLTYGTTGSDNGYVTEVAIQ